MDPLWVSIGVTAVLVCVTGYYAYQTRRIAKTSEDTAKAAMEQTRELQQQRISASQPVVWPAIVGWKINRLDVDFENIGNGPALDIDIIVGSGDEPMSEHCEYVRHGYMVAGEKKEHHFLTADFDYKNSYGLPGFHSNTLSRKAGKYILLIEWRDLYQSGPFFQARLPFDLEIDSEGRLSVNEGVVVIDKVPEKGRGKILQAKL